MSVSFGDRDLPVGIGTAAGIGAWVLAYLFTFVLTSGDIQNSILGRFSDIGTWKIVGWVFFNAHFANTVVDVPVVGGAANFIGGENGFTPLLWVVPPLVLLAAGLAAGRAGGVGDDDPGGAALAGATVVVGYLVLSVVGVFLFATENVAPQAVTGVFLAGFVYPVIFGAIGGVIAAVTG